MSEDPDSEWKTLKKLRTETETVPALLSVSEVAKLFPIGNGRHIQENTVRLWITNGLLEGIKQEGISGSRPRKLIALSRKNDARNRGVTIWSLKDEKN